MKLNLLLDNPNGIRSGYQNIDPFADGSDARIVGDISNLLYAADNGEVTELLAHEILDYFGVDHIDKILDNWIRLLAHGGIIIISCVDYREMAYAILENSRDPAEINALLHGEQKKSWDLRRSSTTMETLHHVLESKELTVLSMKYSDCRAYITAERE